ncbi:MAG: hypothetical protein R2753_05845 [Chitinophagales bacterium]
MRLFFVLLFIMSLNCASAQEMRDVSFQICFENYLRSEISINQNLKNDINFKIKVDQHQIGLNQRKRGRILLPFFVGIGSGLITYGSVVLTQNQTDFRGGEISLIMFGSLFTSTGLASGIPLIRKGNKKINTELL